MMMDTTTAGEQIIDMGNRSFDLGGMIPKNPVIIGRHPATNADNAII
jgi:hypothetical protein